MLDLTPRPGDLDPIESVSVDECLGCTGVPGSSGMMQRQMQLIRDFESDIIMVTPSYMLSIIDEMEAPGVDPRTTLLKVGIFGAEPWTNDMRREMEAAPDMHAVDIYGLSDVIGPGVASDRVETKDGLHAWEDPFYPEVIDPSPARCFQTAKRARWSSPRSPSTRCRSSAIAPAT